MHRHIPRPIKPQILSTGGKRKNEFFKYHYPFMKGHSQETPTPQSLGIGSASRIPPPKKKTARFSYLTTLLFLPLFFNTHTATPSPSLRLSPVHTPFFADIPV